MTFINKCFFAFLLVLTVNLVQAGEHAEESHHEEEKGPKGGKLLEYENFALELTIFETSVNPEMRVYAYQNGELIAPSSVDLRVQLNRLGGEVDQLQFTAEGDYLVSTQSVREPHSYNVDVSARINQQPVQWQFESFEGRTIISDRLLTLANVKSEVAQGQTLAIKDTLFGVIEAPTESVFRINAPYPGLVEQVFVKVGDRVKKGQALARLKNTETLQSYTLKSQSSGEVTAVMANTGDRAQAAALLEITNLETVWVELSAFPQSIEKLAVGQRVSVYDMHQHEMADSTISYIAPQMTGGHIARARAVINNPDGHWRPGMHIKADVNIASRKVPLAVRVDALQTYRDAPVVFAKYGNTFEVRMVELGESDGRFVEVLDGLKSGTEYVTENSYLLKADLLKAGASHDH